ncbi:tyrosine-type recombinase/integrase, partial [Promicromonospora sukumoe]
MPVGTHGKITVTPYADGGKTRLFGEGKTWRTPDGEQVPMKRITWIARCRFRDNDGRTRPVEAWGTTSTGADQSLQTALAARKRASSETITAETRLEVLADYWLRTKIDPSERSVNTKQRYRDVTEHDVIPGLGGLRLRECTVSRLESWVAEQATQRAATARLCLTCLKGMFDVAVREDALSVNPARSVSAIPVEETEVRALGLPDVIKLRAALAADERARAQELADLVDVMLATGCRVGEALALRWEDIDLDQHVVYITGTVVREQGVRLFRQDTTKGKKPRGHLVPAFAMTMLKRRAEQVPGGDLGL